MYSSTPGHVNSERSEACWRTILSVRAGQVQPSHSWSRTCLKGSLKTSWTGRGEEEMSKGHYEIILCVKGPFLSKIVPYLETGGLIALYPSCP